MTTHIRSYSYCELSSCMPVTPVTAAAFGIIAVEMPVCPLSGGIVWARRVCFSGTGNKIVFCLVESQALLSQRLAPEINVTPSSY